MTTVGEALQTLRGLEHLGRVERALETSTPDGDHAREDLEQLRQLIAARTPSVPLSIAAVILGLSRPTIDRWIEHGLLDEVSQGRTRQVTLSSVAELKPLVDGARAGGRSRRLMDAVLARLDEAATLADNDRRQSPDAADHAASAY